MPNMQLHFRHPCTIYKPSHLGLPFLVEDLSELYTHYIFILTHHPTPVSGCYVCPARLASKDAHLFVRHKEGHKWRSPQVTAPAADLVRQGDKSG